MGLSCECDYEHDFCDHEWLWYTPNDYGVLSAKRSRKCVSCGDRIEVGAVVACFERRRGARYAVEERLWGDDGVPLASWFHCERCADLFFSITELGYCISLNDDMRELVKEYAAMAKEKALPAGEASK